ncbi:MAG: SaoD/DsrE family protein [Rubricoccaceae bacterium]
MTVAYVFATSGNTVHYKLGQMILPQLEADAHGARVAGMFFFDDNCFALRVGDPLGERLAKVAAERGMLLMLCDQCASARGLARRVGADDAVPARFEATGTVAGVQVGCFPDLYAALAGAGVDQVITL